MLCGLWMTVEVVLLMLVRVNKRGPVLRKPEVEEKRNAVKRRSHHQREAMSVERAEGGSGMLTQQRRDGGLPSLWVTVNLSVMGSVGGTESECVGVGWRAAGGGPGTCAN